MDGGTAPAANADSAGGSTVLPAGGAAAKDGEAADAAKPARKPIPTNWRPRFLAKLGETSNVTAAALHTPISLTIVYKHRRTDPVFRAAWFAALAEGYDNLEMELLQHLRAVETGGETEEPAKRRAFDTATAFRCLVAHRDSVAREKGRRTLDHEVATIASINEKIDRLRLNAKAADQAIRAARASNRARSRGASEGGAGDARGAGGATNGG